MEIKTMYGRVTLAADLCADIPTNEYTHLDNIMDIDFKSLIAKSLANNDIAPEVIDKIATDILARISGPSALDDMKTRLGILFDYEKKYLELVKEFKEEIKFAGSIQEDLRKERAKFFSDTLKEVSLTLQECQVESSVASVWVKELVGSYTKSLDLSSGLIEEQVIDTVGKIRDEARAISKAVDASGKS